MADFGHHRFMSQLNPYARFLDDRSIETILAASPTTLASLLKQIGATRATISQAPGKWSAAEILSHLADCELVFAFRLRQTLAEDAHVIQPFDQNKWAVNYSGASADEALVLYTALRSWNLRLIQQSLPTAADRVVTHPERGTMTFGTIVETMAGHDLNHIAQLKAISEA
jgi:hypothetical protein